MINKDGLVVARNHRVGAIKELKGENLTGYINKAKKIFNENVFKGFNEKKTMIVRILEKMLNANITTSIKY